MELIVYEHLKRMSVMISGAIAFYEIEGDENIQVLRQQKKDGLVTGMKTMGAALYWLRRQMEAFVRAADVKEKA